MKKFLSVLFFVAALSFLSAARQLTVNEAFTRALNHNRLNLPSMMTKTFDLPTPAYISSKGGINQFYVFNTPDGEGFVVVSADDCAAPLLGYSENGVFDINNLPDNINWWLSQYQQEIEYAISHDIPYMKLNAPERSEIKPLVQTKWNQNEPYNNFCPKIGESTCVTGCVPTSMSQIMNYHQWPEQGTGYKEYSWGDGILSMNFSDITFNWQDMLDVYNDESPANNCDAVATLMYATGISVKTAYSPSGSSATSMDVPSALINNFGYDKGCQVLYRKYYDSDEWNDIIYGEVSNHRPVIYSGLTTNNVGHSFVCDGYRDGYFHINWGWGGVSDGYFLLSALSPNIQGIGGSSGSFVIDQTAVTGIQKPVPGSECPVSFGMNNDFSTEKDTYNINKSVEFIAAERNNGFFNLGSEEITIHYGVKVVSSNGKIVHYASTKEYTVSPFVGYSSFRTDLNAVSPGTYTVSPAFLTQDGEWHDILVPNGYVKQLSLTATATTLTFAPIKVNPDFKVENFQMLTPMYEGCYFKALANFTAKSEYSTILYVGLYDIGSDKPRAFGDKVNVLVKPGETTTLEYISKISGYFKSFDPPVPGDYQLRLTDNNNKPISDPIDVTYLSSPGTVGLVMESLYLETGHSAPLDDISISGTVKCTKGYFANNCLIGMFPYPGGQPLATFDTPIFFLAEGESADFNMHVEYPEGEPGSKYFIVGYVYSGKDPIKISNDYWIFTLTEPVPVIDVTSITLDKTEVEMNVNTMLQLTATINSDASDQTIFWISDNPQVATVDQKGFIRGISEGVATITAKAGGLAAECIVTVIDPDGIIDTEISAMSMSVSGRTLILHGIDRQKLIKVTNSCGSCIYEGYDHNIILPASGVYLVTIGSKCIKAIVR